ncbi:NACHT domain-containing protein [Actinoallomurus bryophytorum]|uniref:NACHT domain-containing protein n=1 Tax=Actinoallomurus bryophytorum TaxID=1490222 RepID=UPI0011539B66|nr:NACHT domain-containing protein [Actinoallomurus bryophytorum]
MLLAAAVVLLAATILVRAWLAGGSDEFNRWVGWANVWGLGVSAFGVVLVVADKLVDGSGRAELGVAEAETELAAVVLAQATVARSRLIGTGEVEDRAANVRFIKGAGRFREVGGAGEGDLESVLGYYRSLSPGRLVVLGAAGSGKTVLVLELVVRLLEQRRRERGGPVPVVISAAAWETGRGFEKWFEGHLAARFGMGVKVAGRLVRDRRVIPVVDGLDEMDPSGQPERARTAVRALNSYMAGLERAAMVVTCRSEEHAALGVEVDRATHVEIVPLGGGEAAGYLLDQLRDEDELSRWGPVLEELENHPDGLVARQLATPWRLTLALTVFRDGGDPAELLPDPASGQEDRSDPVPEDEEEHGRRVERLLLSRYVPAAVRLHDPDGRYPVEKVQCWLTALAAGLDWQARHGRSATDIEMAQWWRPAGQRATRLPHVALAAVPGMAALVAGVITRTYPLLALAVPEWILAVSMVWRLVPRRLNVGHLVTRRGLRRLTTWLAFGLVSGLVGGLAGGLAGGIAWGLVGGLVAGLVGGLVAGLIRGLMWGPMWGLTGGLAGGITGGLAGGLADGLADGLAIGLAGGFAGGLAVGLAAAFSDPSPEPVSPQDVIHADGRFGLTLGLTFGLPSGLVVGLVVGLTVGFASGLVGGLVGGLTGGLTGWLALGSNVWLRYHICVVVSASRGRTPLRFGAFLEWAYRADVLRVSGVAYQFRHRQLQDWLTPRTRP